MDRGLAAIIKRRTLIVHGWQQQPIPYSSVQKEQRQGAGRSTGNFQDATK